MRSKMKVERHYIGPIFKLCIGSISSRQRWQWWQQWQRWQQHNHRWTARTRTQRTHWRTTQRPSASRSESRPTWGSEGECFSSFPYFFIIVLFFISLSSCFFTHNMASIPHYHTLFYSEFKHSSPPSFPLFFQIPVETTKLYSHYSWCLKWTVPLICFNLGIPFWTQKELGKWKWQILFAFLMEVCKSANNQFLTVNVRSNTCQSWISTKPSFLETPYVCNGTSGRSHDWRLFLLL